MEFNKHTLMSKSQTELRIYGRDETVVTTYAPVNNDTSVAFPPLMSEMPDVKSSESKTPVPLVGTSDFAHMQNLGDLPKDEVAEVCFQRAKIFLDRNDPMQASEKLYKATEDAIKFLSQENKIKTLERVEKAGQWWTGLLGQAAKELARRTGKKEIDEAWRVALDLHIIGFHENAYSVEDVRPAVPIIEKLIRYVREVSNGRRKANP